MLWRAEGREGDRERGEKLLSREDKWGFPLPHHFFLGQGSIQVTEGNEEELW